MPIYQTARYAVRQETVDECLEAIKTFVAYVGENEPGTRIYTALQTADDPTLLLHTFIFEDEAAREIHRTSAAVQQFTSILYPNTLDGVEFTEHFLVATTAT
jgi:quinol monooxygenase YgiN